jgi:hypothetical protein
MERCSVQFYYSILSFIALEVSSGNVRYSLLHWHIGMETASAKLVLRTLHRHFGVETVPEKICGIYIVKIPWN